MKKMFLALSLLAMTTAVSAQNSIPTAEVVFESQSVIPGNLAISENGDIYISVNPLLNPSSKLYKVTSKSDATPFPNAAYVTGEESTLGGVLGVKVDEDNNLWMLDMNKHQFVVWDLDDNELEDTIAIPKSVTKPNSFLQDFIIDEKNDRVIIADMTMGSAETPAAPAFIVYDMESEKFQRMAENQPSLLSEVEGGFNLNPIAIDPSGKWIYYGALKGRKIYRVPAKSFANEDTLIENIELFGDKSYSDGIVVDDNGVVYVTNIEDNAISVTTKDGFENIAMLPEGQVWPDGLYIGEDGYVYSTMSQLSRSAILNNGKDPSIAPYIIVKTPKIK